MAASNDSNVGRRRTAASAIGLGPSDESGHRRRDDRLEEPQATAARPAGGRRPAEGGAAQRVPDAVDAAPAGSTPDVEHGDDVVAEAGPVEVEALGRAGDAVAPQVDGEAAERGR